MRGHVVDVQGGQLQAIHSRFIDNRCYRCAPDLGGGAIDLDGHDRPPMLIDSTDR